MSGLLPLQRSEIDCQELIPILFYKTQPHHAVELSLLLRVLKIPYRLRPSEEYNNISLIKILDPNGNNPIMYDENNEMYLSEQSAIIEYLLDTYDINYKISFPRGTKEYYTAKQFHGLQSRYTAAITTLGKLRPSNALLSDFQKVVEEGLSMLENALNDRLPGMDLNSMTIIGKRSSYVDILFLCWIFVFVNGRSPGPFTKAYPLVHCWWMRLLGSKVVQNVFSLCIPAKDKKEQETVVQIDETPQV
ncbi:hypothetical protein F4678DRAFT_466828 [Xylaria arbuscula]|nr:hypothetical protein F4678DRAFT_466828 [Xylaria arbuscula]